MLKDKEWNVAWGEKREATDIIAMSDQVHITKSYLPPYFITSALSTNPKLYRMLRVKGEVKGMYALFPMSKASLGGVLSGDILDLELNQHIVNYRLVKEVYLYLHSFVVDLFDAESKDYTRALVYDLAEVLTDLQTEGIDIKLVSAVASTEGGEKIAKRLGFQQDDYQVTRAGAQPIMYATVQDILNHIKL